MNRRSLIPDDMRTAIDLFYSDAEEIVNAFCIEIDKCPPPAVIYHYTNDIGLRGIIETGKLRCTDIFYLNDPTELKHGVEPALELLSAARDESRPEIAHFSQNLSAMLRGGIEQIARYFTCSFSAAGDDLGQWRAYADNGRGFAIGFDGAILEQAFVKEIPGPGRMSFPVSYSEGTLRALHGKIIAGVVPLLSMPRGRDGLASQALNDYMSELSTALSVPVLRSALFFKHEAYKNEQEYRFLEMFMAGFDVPDVKYGSRPYSLTPYREFSWRAISPESLKQIIVGPAPDKNLASKFARDCLRAFHHRPDKVEIKPSPIPYRAHGY